MANSNEIKGESSSNKGDHSTSKDAKSSVNKSSSSSSGSSVQSSMPKDGQVMMSILKDMGVNDFEPKVVNQLLEFSYRYVTNVLDDAKAVSGHAGKKAIDVDDVRLAVQMYAEQNVTTPPSREILLDMARTKNANPLPIPKPTCGLRLPPDRHCLTACNYRVKYKPKARPTAYGSAGLGPAANSPSIRTYQKQIGNAPKIVQPGIAMMNSGAKITPGAPMANISLSPQVAVAGGGAGANQAPVFKISVNPQSLQNVAQPIKRKADEME